MQHCLQNFRDRNNGCQGTMKIKQEFITSFSILPRQWYPIQCGYKNQSESQGSVHFVSNNCCHFWSYLDFKSYFLKQTLINDNIAFKLLLENNGDMTKAIILNDFALI